MRLRSVVCVKDRIRTWQFGVFCTEQALEEMQTFWRMWSVTTPVHFIYLHCELLDLHLEDRGWGTQAGAAPGVWEAHSEP